MKSSLFLALLGVTLFIACARADCGDAAAKDADDGEVKAWFKNLGCKITKGAEDLSDSAKPWADKIATSTKELGSSIAQKYDEVKHKLTDDNSAAASSTPGAGGAALHNAPTEKIPLAPLTGEVPAAAAAAAAAPAATDERVH